MKVVKEAFNAGYVMAGLNLVHTHGEATMAADLFAEAGITQSFVRSLDLCEYDQEAFSQVLREMPPEKVKQ